MPWEKETIPAMISNVISLGFIGVAAHKEDELELKGKALSIPISRLMKSAVVYGIWKERNDRMFRNDHKDDMTLSFCTDTIRCRRQKVQKSDQNRWLKKSWQLPDSTF